MILVNRQNQHQQPDWHRSRNGIIFEILRTTKECEQRGGAKRLRLLYASRLSSSLLKKYLGELVRSGLVTEDDTNSREIKCKGKPVKRGNVYHITKLGMDYVTMYQEMQNNLGPGVHL